jgi:invasion protein IalB
MRLFRLALLLMVAPVIAHAQAPKQPVTPGAAPPAGVPPAGAPPVSADPQATSATYGDWVFVCQREPEGLQQRLCEVSQSIQVQGQTTPIAKLAISKAKQPPATHITVVLPTNVLLTVGPRVSVDDKDTQAVDTAWLRCVPGGCFADAVVKDDVLAKWRAQSERGRLDFRDAAGRSIAVPFSFRGLAAAYDALAKE